MKTLVPVILLLFPVLPGPCQKPERYNTAKGCAYMKDIEKEMIAEINLLRGDPKGYTRYLQDDYQAAKAKLENSGKGEKSFAISTSYVTVNGKERIDKQDTIWNYKNEEEVRAIESLIGEMNELPPLTILLPDKGLYSAAVKHANDQKMHHWNLGHRGSDGSWPWDRIKKYSPKMKSGNENLAAMFPEPSARDIVLLLLIDSGIPGYGHRHNILNPQWQYVACYSAGLQEGIYQWVQEFGY